MTGGTGKPPDEGNPSRIRRIGDLLRLGLDERARILAAMNQKDC